MSRVAVLVPVGTIVFTISWLILGVVSPGYQLFGHTIAPYSWVSQPVSGLGLGVTGPWMNTAFVLSGSLLLAGVLSTAPSWGGGGLRRTAFVLIALMGAGMITCGVFTLTTMMLHLTGFLLAVPLPAIGLIIAGLSWRHDSPRLGTVGVAGGALTLVLFAVFQATFDATGAGGNTGVSGLVQRALILTAMSSVSFVIMTVAAGAHPHSPLGSSDEANSRPDHRPVTAAGPHHDHRPSPPSAPEPAAPES